MLVLVDRSEGLVTEHVLRLGVFLQLKDELVDFLSATAHVALRGVCLHVQPVQLLLQLGNLLILALDLLFFDVEQALHVRVLLLQVADCVVFATILLEQLAKLLVRVNGKLLHLSLD